MLMAIDPRRRIAVREQVREIARVIEAARVRSSTETQAHDDVEAALASAGMAVQREVIIDARSRIDLMVGRIAIEVKVGGAKRAIWRQVHRYAEHPDVDGVVLATGVALPRSQMDAAGKPFAVASLSRGWL